MSKGTKVILSLAILLIAAGAVFFSVRDFPSLLFGDPVFTEEIPESRPKRLDRREMARFEGKSMEEILALLSAEKSGEGDSPQTSPPGVDERLLQALPDAPLPFPEEAEARNEEWLRTFVTSMKQDDAAEPTPAELWSFNLALAALKISPSQLPEALRRNTRPTPESDTLSVHFTEQTEDLIGPFAVGDFDGEPGLEIIDQGGARMNRLTASGNFIPAENSLARFPGKGVYPADFDQDGDLDLYLTRGDGFPDSLLQNQGKGQFKDVTTQVGLLAFRDSTAASWIDYDVDGRPDLLVGSKDQPLELYHQTANGTFQPVAWDLKLWVPRGVREIETREFSGDGFPEFFLGIDGLADRLYANRPAEVWTDWRFDNIIPIPGWMRLRTDLSRFVISTVMGNRISSFTPTAKGASQSSRSFRTGEICLSRMSPRRPDWIASMPFPPAVLSIWTTMVSKTS